MARTTSSRATARSGGSRSSGKTTSKATSKQTSKVTTRVSSKDGKSSSTSKSHETKARESLQRSLARDFSTKTESERKRIENQIVKKVLRTEQDSWHLARRHGQTKEYWLAKEVRKCEKEYARRKNEETKYYTSEEERINHTPRDSERGNWIGERGKSRFKPNKTKENEEMINYLEKNGLDGIEYDDGVVDFYMISEATVEIPNMTGNRTGQKGNFEQAYAALAEKWNNDERDGKTNWTSRDVKKWAEDKSEHNGYALTVHENPDTKTCDFVRSDIHAFFTHSGGVSECNHRDNSDDNGGFDE